MYNISRLGAVLFLLSIRPLLIFFNDTATTEIYTLSLHDALPISSENSRMQVSIGFASRPFRGARLRRPGMTAAASVDRKSTRLNSSHANISYAVFCLKKKQTLRAGDRKSTRLNSSHANISYAVFC